MSVSECPEATCGDLAGVYRSTEAVGSFAQVTLVLDGEPCQLHGAVSIGESLAPIAGWVCPGAEITVEGGDNPATASGILEVVAGALVGEIEIDFVGDDDVDAGTYTELVNAPRLTFVRLEESCVLHCDDGDPCTDDTCDPLSGFECLHAARADDDPCEDGDLCTTFDRCSNGNCIGTPVTCADVEVCSDNECNPDTGDCDAVANTEPCDDGDDCTDADVCADFVCAGTPVAACCGNTICEAPETCDTCGTDCASVTTGPASARYCCGNGAPETAEGDGTICDGNY